jgi:hypothetical protein
LIHEHSQRSGSSALLRGLRSAYIHCLACIRFSSHRGTRFLRHTNLGQFLFVLFGEISEFNRAADAHISIVPLCYYCPIFDYIDPTHTYKHLPTQNHAWLFCRQGTRCDEYQTVGSVDGDQSAYYCRRAVRYAWKGSVTHLWDLAHQDGQKMASFLTFPLPYRLPRPCPPFTLFHAHIPTPSHLHTFTPPISHLPYRTAIMPPLTPLPSFPPSLFPSILLLRWQYRALNSCISAMADG